MDCCLVGVYRGGTETIYVVRVVEFKHSMKHSLEDENNRSIKYLLFGSCLFGPRINPNTKAIVISKGGEEGIRQNKETLAFVTM